MPTIKIDNQDYDTDTLAPEAKAQLEMVLLTEQKIRQLQGELAIAQTARGAYVQALRQQLATAGDTIKLS